MKEYIRSAVEVSQIALDAGKLICSDIVEFGKKIIDQKDTEKANAINGVDDE